MKIKTAFWTIAVLCCIGLGVWQRENLSIIWLEYSSLYKHIKYEDGSMKTVGPFIPPKVAKEDPEAAAVAEISLGRLDRKADERLEAVAEKLLEYPDNKFLLFELIRYLHWHESIIDPQITLKLAERLIKIEPDNAHYHYMKCHLLLMDRCGNNIDAALEEMEYANKCREYGFPYDSYRQQVINIADRAKLGRFLLRELQYFGGGNPFASDVWQELIGRANMAFTDGDTAKGMRITDALAEMQKRQLRDGDPYARAVRNLRFFSGAFSFSFGHWIQPQGLELQRVDLTKERARKNRLQLCALTAPPKKVTEKSKDQDKKEQEKRAAFLAVHPAVHAGEMFVAFLWGCVVLLLISTIRGFGERNKIGFFRVFLFIVSCVCYFCITKGFFLAWLLEDFHYYYFSCIDALRPIPGLKYIEYEPVLAGLFLAGPIVAALALWGLGLLRPKKGAFWRFWYVRFLAALGVGLVAAFVTLCAASYRYAGLWQECAITGVLVGVSAWVIITFAWWLFRCRIIRLFLVATFLGAVTVLASGYQYVHYLPMIVFVLTSAIIAVVKPGERSSFKTMLRLFSRKPDVTAVRNKCLRLTAPFIVVYWVLFITLTPLVAKSINLELEEFKPIERKVVLPEPNEAYQELMSTFEAEGLSKMHIYRLLGLVMPEDLPAVLGKLKNRKFADVPSFPDIPGGIPSFRPKATEEEKARLEKRRERQRWLNDGDLVLAMRGCGRDVVDVITGFLDKPDAERALVARARLGDSTTREKLEELLQARMQSELDEKEHEQPMRHRTYLDRPTKAAEIVGALACISEPNEAVRRFLDYIQNREVSDLIENHEFFNGLSLLPITQAHRVINSYLDKAHSWQPRVEKTPYGLFRNSPDRVLYPLRRLVGFYCDRQIAEAAFKITLLVANADDEFEPWEISPYFTDESAQLLKKGLSSADEDLRAWCVWQLRKIGYKWGKEELDKLLTDKSWKVRANAVLAGGKATATLAQRDRNSLIRLAGSFWLQSRH